MFIMTIPQGHCLIVERFGKPARVAKSGLNFFIPVLDKAKDVSPIWGENTNKKGIFIELSEQIIDTKPKECFTRDNVRLLVDCAIRWRITDPVKAVYEVDNLRDSLIIAVLSAIRSYVGSQDLNTVLSSRQQMSEKVMADALDTVKRWGINLIGTEIKELKADEATLDAMRQQLEASRKSEAMKLEAAGKAEALVKEAEAGREAAMLMAQGQSEALKLLVDGEKAYLEMLVAAVGKEAAGKIMLAQKTLKSYETITSNPANKVFIPLATLQAGMITETNTKNS